ncbi:hypothetical protein ACRE_066330 [Hapsidospora chrysogenum ATCC 11550]|uniref:Uncharacterized protein n=1 Tax=Hapsidospora chrysogenum (strain ATCC 11550 / CBS 779.69 / DSM 880 / IAM 14645 / JCM 23072 / IMI 49137) TaxID=857340 RepID=A0A086SZU5_HAPC1|nr:hypothetical protein ACRE_066330 [Hapsidospora chrysogenum ATCC 11550]
MSHVRPRCWKSTLIAVGPWVGNWKRPALDPFAVDGLVSGHAESPLPRAELDPGLVRGRVLADGVEFNPRAIGLDDLKSSRNFQ